MRRVVRFCCLLLVMTACAGGAGKTDTARPSASATPAATRPPTSVPTGVPSADRSPTGLETTGPAAPSTTVGPDRPGDIGAALLVGADLGLEWVAEPIRRGRGNDEPRHPSCRGLAKTDADRLEHVSVLLQRRVQAEGVHHEVDRFEDDRAEAAIAEYRSAFDRCKDYTVADGTSKTKVERLDFQAPRLGDDTVGVLYRTDQDGVVVYSATVVVRLGNHLFKLDAFALDEQRSRDLAHQAAPIAVDRLRGVLGGG